LDDKKVTIGKIAYDLQKTSPSKIDPREIQRATEKEYLDNLIWSVKHARKELDCSNIAGHDSCINRDAMVGDFYIACLLKKEKLLENVLRNYFVPTISCPTPHFDQTVYKYNAAKEDVEFLWVIPDQETCEIFKENKNIIVPEEQHLLAYILDYYNGNLFNMAKRLNGETKYAGSALIGKELWQ
jgi:hypothetical protein